MSSGPAHRVESAAVEYGYPQGHLGHLSGEEEQAFRNFKAYCQENGYFTPADGEKQASHDDPTLLYVVGYDVCPSHILICVQALSESKEIYCRGCVQAVSRDGRLEEGE